MPEPKRERTLYELSSSFFAGVVIVFAVGGLLIVGLGPAGPVSPEFGIFVLFLLLGLGRLYLGLKRGNEGSQDRSNR
jgi:formate hydrogenlyase subunit 4